MEKISKENNKKLICFDFDGVIGKFNVIKLIKKFKGTEKIKFLRIVVHLIGILKCSEKFKELYEDYQCGKLSRENLLKLIDKYYKGLSGVLNEVLDELPGTLEIDGEMFRHVLELKEKGYEICVLTNNMPENKPIIDMVTNCFADRVFYTTELGVRKNNPIAFEKMLDEMGMSDRRENVIFVDDKNKYCKVAESCGIKSINFKYGDGKSIKKLDAELGNLDENLYQL